MKRTLIRRWEYKGNFYNFTFEYWPYIPATLVQPEEGNEINVLSMTQGEVNLPIPDGESEEYIMLMEFLLDQICKEDAELEEAMSTIAVEPWD